MKTGFGIAQSVWSHTVLSPTNACSQLGGREHFGCHAGWQETSPEVQIRGVSGPTKVFKKVMEVDIMQYSP